MSYPRYPKYKASGVEWLGEVPQHWDVTRLGFLCEKIGSGKTPSGGSETYADEGVVFIRSQNVYDEGLFLDDVVFITVETDEAMAGSRVREGDVLLNITGASLGRTCLVPNGFTGGNVNQHVCIIRLIEQTLREFAAMFLKSADMKAQIDATQNGAARDGLNYAQISKLALTLPPTAEQSAIASFLGRETSKIDGLVGEQRRLIELLKEKRQAVISHAVTKGLNPHAPLKPSGIEWLGDVPEHWDVLSLRRVSSSVQTGGTPSSVLPADEVDAGQVWYTPGDFGDSLRLTTSARMLPLEVAASGDAKVFPPRSVLVVSIGATLGKVGFAEGVSAANQQINAVIPNEKIDGYFCAYSLSAKAEVMRFLSNASTIGIMNQEKTKDIWLAVPPMSEQVEITAHLDHATAKLDALTAEAERGIELLQERRTALISAAVTGQIDVRGLVTS